MMIAGVFYALLSGICNGLFSAPMKMIETWRWENLWLVFVLMSCVLMPACMVLTMVDDVRGTLAALPGSAVAAALLFGFAWGFGAILFGLSVDRLGVSLANSLVIGLSSALGSIVPLLMERAFRLEFRHFLLLLGVCIFVAGVWLCGRAGCIRDVGKPTIAGDGRSMFRGYLFATGAGVMSAVFNIGYTLALPIADTGERLGLSRFTSTNLIWLLMLGAGSIPNIVFCARLLAVNRTARLFRSPELARTWGLSLLMGLLWGGSIFLYGAATPLLGDSGPSIGWPLSLATGLLVANLMGYLLGEWKAAERRAVRLMRMGIGVLLAAIVTCAASTKA